MESVSNNPQQSGQESHCEGEDNSNKFEVQEILQEIWSPPTSPLGEITSPISVGYWEKKYPQQKKQVIQHLWPTESSTSVQYINRL